MCVSLETDARLCVITQARSQLYDVHYVYSVDVLNIRWNMAE